MKSNIEIGRTVFLEKHKFPEHSFAVGKRYLSVQAKGENFLIDPSFVTINGFC